MAYSRFSNSIWYTFWSSHEGTETRYKLPTQDLKDSQVFQICDIPSFDIKYGDIRKKGINEILNEIKEFYSKPHEVHLLFSKENEGFLTSPRFPSYEEMEELKGYIIEFVKDVDEYFIYTNFFIEEWYKPLMKKIFK
jgi:hypothetical protein